MAIQRRDITDDEIIEAYSIYKNLSSIAVHFNVPHITIHRRCKLLGLKFKNGGTTVKYDLFDILDGKHPQYQSNKLKKRLLKENILDDKCDICGIDEWNGKKLIMQLDHINGISNDHRLENIRLLCPNCHSQTDTWCGRNK